MASVARRSSKGRNAMPLMNMKRNVRYRKGFDERPSNDVGVIINVRAEPLHGEIRIGTAKAYSSYIWFKTTQKRCKYHHHYRFEGCATGA